MSHNIEIPQKFNNIYCQSFSIPSTILYYIFNEASFKTKLKLYQTCKQFGLKFLYEAETFEHCGFSKSVVKIEDAIIPIKKFCATYCPLKAKSVKYEYLGFQNGMLKDNVESSTVENLKITTSLIYYFNDLSAFLTPNLKKIHIQQCIICDFTELYDPLRLILHKSENLESITFGALNLRPYDRLHQVYRIKKLQEANFYVYQQVDVESITHFVTNQMASESTLKLLFHIAEIAQEFTTNLKEFYDSQIIAAREPPKFTYYTNLYSVVFQRL